ncbi:hypothetical protein XENOCAPTIV_016921 [Xenoophorus captivus]|uniref:Uncharacterized protein n=1 Tax=Xenoophorus captivus TaxID=1517983 RepID=A0ABV0S1M6_9TELE
MAISALQSRHKYGYICKCNHSVVLRFSALLGSGVAARFSAPLPLGAPLTSSLASSSAAGQAGAAHRLQSPGRSDLLSVPRWCSVQFSWRFGYEGSVIVC